MTDKRAFEALEIADALDRIAKEIADAGINGFGNAVMAEAERLRSLDAGREGQLGALIHYPEHWDTAAYPTLDDALREIGCSECRGLPKADAAAVPAHIRADVEKNKPRGEVGMTAEMLPWVYCAQLIKIIDAAMSREAQG